MKNFLPQSRRLTGALRHGTASSHEYCMRARPPAAAAGVTPDSISSFVREQWPSMAGLPHPTCHAISRQHVIVSIVVPASSIRPGGFICGPTQFALADLALWYASFGVIGLEAMALTSELSIRFLRPAKGNMLWARADLNSIGTRQIVGTVTAWTDDFATPSSVSQGTYVLPRQRDSQH